MGVKPPMPDVGPVGYLVEKLLELKIATATEQGLQPRTWSEVLAFSQATESVNEPWERRVLFDMSWEYVQEFSKASSPFMKSPMER